MKGLTRQLVFTLVAIQLVAWATTGLLVVAFAPRLLLLDPTVVEGSTYPNSEGETLKRVVTRITADTLVYENPATTRGERLEAAWKKLN